jgi:signal transduction histidine kinase
VRNAPHDIRAALGVIVGSAGLLQQFHRRLAWEDIELLAGEILEAAMSLDRVAGRLRGPKEERPPARPRRTRDGAVGPSSYVDVRSAAKEAAFREGRRPDLQLDLEEVPVTAAPALVRRIVAELVHDAFHNTDRGTAVRVTLRAERPGCRLEVTGGPQSARRPHRRRKLTAARRHAEAAGANLEVDDGAGTPFTVRVRWLDSESRSVRVRTPATLA